jgi:FkbM family methyltransferase
VLLRRCRAWRFLYNQSALFVGHVMVPFIRRISTKLLARRSRTTFSIHGVKLRFAVIEGDSGDQIRSGFESEIYEYIDGLPESSVFYDLGASIGHFAMYAASRGLKTYAFEPDSKNFRALVLNKKQNNLPNLSVFNVAIADGMNPRGVLLSNSNKDKTGDHHKVLKVGENSASQSILGCLDTENEVETWSIDQAIEIKGLPVPNYMKVDIDGSEVAFLKGATKTLANPLLNGFIIELSKDSQYFNFIAESLRASGFYPVHEYQIYSSIGIEPNLFNMAFARSR